MPDDCYTGGKALIRVEPNAGHVTAVFDDGSFAMGDLLVAADGLRSTVRTQLLPEIKPRYAGYVAWRGVVEAQQIAHALHELVFHRMVFGFPDRELMLSIPMPGQHGERCCHFVWFRPVTENELLELCTDSSGHGHGVSIPPPLIRAELIATIKSDACDLLAPQLAALVNGTAQIILQPIFDLESSRIAFERVALVGDAAFVARPHVATGVMKAAIDAEALTDALANHGNDIAAGLIRYDRERRPYGAWLVERGRHIGGYFEAIDVEPRQRAETLMREYGAAGIVSSQPIAARAPG